MFSMPSQSCDQILVKIGLRSRSHGHILYTAKMHHNSLLDGPVNFVVGADMWTTPK